MAEMINRPAAETALATHRFRGFSPFKEFVNLTFPWLEFDGSRRTNFAAEATGYAGMQHLAVQLRMDGLHVARPKRRAEADGHAYIKFFWQLSGMTELAQGRQSVTMRPGDTTVCDTARGYDLRISDDSHFAVLLLPHDACPGWPGIADDLVATRLRDEITARAALSALMSAMRHEPADGDTAAIDGVVNSVQTMLCDSLQRTAAPAARRAGTARQSAGDVIADIYGYIRRHLHEPDLSPGALAKAVRLSRRGLYLALERHGLTPARMITDMRLAGCRRALADPARGQQTITEIAFEFGFSDAARFSHIFRARHGMPPSVWRERALQDERFFVAGRAETDDSPDAETVGDTAPVLTSRECGVLARLAEGAGNADIARELFVSENTVKFHLKNIYRKLGVSGRVPAIRAAQHLGLVE